MANPYEKTISAKSFAGIIQDGDGVNLNLRYATEAVNCDTDGGDLKPMRGGKLMTGTTAAPIGTLMRLYRRNVAAGTEPNVFVAAAGTKLYYKLLSASTWTEVSGLTLQSDEMSFVNYETVRKYAFTLSEALVEDDYVKFDPDYNTVTVFHNGVESLVTATACVQTSNTQLTLSLVGSTYKYVVGEDGLEAGNYYVAHPDNVDILLMTNKKDGMIAFFGDNFGYMTVTTPYRFGCLARHYERIWGGDCDGYPDMLAYSAPYDAFDWEQNTDIPEDGGGEISQPSWDGDGFIALTTYGSYLLALKKNKLWRIMGTNPSEYIMKEQFGGGTAIRKSVCVNGDYVLMYGYLGLSVYDGDSVSDFHTNYLTDMFTDSQGLTKNKYRVNMAYIDKACAVMRGTTYCLAVPLGDSVVNNAVIEYNTKERTFLLRYGVYVNSFLTVDDEVYYTSSVTPNAFYKYAKGDFLPMRWVSSWQDLNALDVVKSCFLVYVQPETDSAFTLNVSIETEKKKKTKQYTVTKDKTNKHKSIRFGNSGRKFRFILETAKGGVNWRLSGGVQIEMDLDED